MAKYQRILGHNKLKKRQTWRNVLLLLAMSIGLTICVTAVIIKVAWTQEHDTGRSAAGAEAMLNKFVDTGKKPSSFPINQLIDRSHRITIPDRNRTLAFLHIGKSGGSTISLLLRNGCMTAVDADAKPCEANRWLQNPGQTRETIASQRIQFYLHTPHVESGKMAEYYKRVSSVVVVARDPLERFVSAFLCRHPRNIDATRNRNVRIRKRAEREGVEPPIWAKQVWGGGDVEMDQVYRAAYMGCYPNVEELANCAASPSPSESDKASEIYTTRIRWVKRGSHSKEISLNCRDICQGIVSGENKYVHHVRFNYEAFLKDLPPENEIFVIRTMQLWQDWVDVNNMLGSNRNVEVPNKGSDEYVINARGSLPIRNNLSDHGRT
eukprot:CAMPEP_0172323216 /NCGR_PEP_ID=MMETSP1058-20130122/48176_1 /TAXON_ID=83371 /ORGANISM="Detonula confervacea, Strain CCMP 353" /LENGTH=379 /DNA_ID=CAMNT_0013039169 /DNA_START=11 /DNA_END=1147 /DNA_ORIENTATION=+